MLVTWLGSKFGSNTGASGRSLVPCAPRRCSTPMSANNARAIAISRQVVLEFISLKPSASAPQPNQPTDEQNRSGQRREQNPLRGSHFPLSHPDLIFLHRLRNNPLQEDITT